MKIIMAQPENLRFEWELKVALNNLRSFNIKDVILLMLTTGDIEISRRLKKRVSRNFNP